MGSTDKAVITGFICRLCSKMNRFVIHIYGEEGERMKLAEKINTYLPITVILRAYYPTLTVGHSSHSRPVRETWIDFHFSHFAQIFIRMRISTWGKKERGPSHIRNGRYLMVFAKLISSFHLLRYLINLGHRLLCSYENICLNITHALLINNFSFSTTLSSV